MMSPALEELLFSADLADEVEGAEPGPDFGGGAPGAELVGGGASGAEEGGGAADEASAAVCAPVTCWRCGDQVCERYFLLAAGRAWHTSCLRCSQCGCELQTRPSLFWRDGDIFCQQDYNRMFGGGRCARCLQPIPASALVMRSGDLSFHPRCFSCQECDVTLLPGNLYVAQGSSLYCHSHHRHGNRSDGDAHNPQPRPLLREAQNPASGEGEESASSSEPRLDERVSGGRSRRRSKRIRTCFRSEQLRALESYFLQKHNPDGKDWTCLAHKTGLPKRVLQVWFQNARAKLRRSLTCDDSQVGSAPRASVGMTTDSPPQAPPPQAPPPQAPPPPGSSPADQSRPFSTSTIDRLQLSLLTGPPSPALFLDYTSQGAPGRDPALEAREDFEEGGQGGAFGPHFS